MLEETAPPRPAAFPAPDDDAPRVLASDRALRWCTWCAPVFVVVFFAGMLMAGILPPPSPVRTPQQVADFWASNRDLKKIGLSLMMVASGLTLPFGVAVAVQMKRMEGRWAPMAYLMLAAAAVGVLVIDIPVMIFMAAAFRPRDPVVTQALTDTAFIPFVMNWPPAALQAVSLGVVCLGRHRLELFPRWLGYLSLWIAFLFIPGSFVPFFLHGAFAWNGLLSFWVVATLFGGWFLTVFVMVRRSLTQTETVL